MRNIEKKNSKTWKFFENLRNLKKNFNSIILKFFWNFDNFEDYQIFIIEFFS